MGVEFGMEDNGFFGILRVNGWCIVGARGALSGV